MKILLSATTIRDGQNLLRMMRPGVMAVDGGGRIWRSGDDWYQIMVPGERIVRDSGFDRALVLNGTDGRVMAWVQQQVAPSMGGVGTELVVIG